MPPKGWNVPKHYTGDDVKGLVAWLQRVLRDLKTFFSYVPTYNDRKTELEITGNIIMQPGATVDGVDISELKVGGGEVPDNVVLNDGTTPFVAPQPGVSPVTEDHLATRGWVEGFVWGVAFGGIPPKQPNPSGWIPPPVPAHPIKIGGIGVIADDLRDRFAQLPQGNISPIASGARSRVVWDEERHRFIFMVGALPSGSSDVITSARLVTYDPTDDSLSVVNAGVPADWLSSGPYDRRSLYLGYDGSSYIYSARLYSSGSVGKMRRHPIAGGDATDFNYTMGPEFAASSLQFHAVSTGVRAGQAMATQFFVHDPAYPTGFWALHTSGTPPNTIESHLAWVSTSSGQVASIVNFGAMGLRLVGAAGRVGRWLYFFAEADSMSGTVEPYEHSGLFRIHLDDFTLEHVFGNGITAEEAVFGQSSSTPAVLGHLVCATSDQVWVAVGDTSSEWGGCSYIYRIDVPTGVSTPITSTLSSATWKIDSEITYPCSSPFTGDMSSAGTPAQFGFAPDVNNARTYSIGSLASATLDLAVCYHWESDLL